MTTTTRPVPRGRSNDQAGPTPIPPLRNGDRLTAVEFERRYHAMPHLKKAELIEGIVYIPSPDFYPPAEILATMPSPVSFGRHASPHFDAVGWLYQYRSGTAAVSGGDNGSIRLDLDNMPQPDAFLIIRPEAGGQARISEDDYIVGAPEFVLEVSYSSASYDLHAKLNVYRRNGVREYVVWRVEDEAIDWFVNRDGNFERLGSGPDGILRSEALPGLWLDSAALIRGDAPAVLQVVLQGLISPEHAAFVEQLRQRVAADQPPTGGERP